MYQYKKKEAEPHNRNNTKLCQRLKLPQNLLNNTNCVKNSNYTKSKKNFQACNTSSQLVISNKKPKTTNCYKTTNSQPQNRLASCQTSQTVSKNLKSQHITTKTCNLYTSLQPANTSSQNTSLHHTNLLSLNLKTASSKNQNNSVNSKQ